MDEENARLTFPAMSDGMEITQFVAESRSTIINRWRFDEMQLHQMVRIEGDRGGRTDLCIH